jgi:tRNA/tmRNA/rRNA uracil-C5-methylase (TrmA/RlmC/RlmD family)
LGPDLEGVLEELNVSRGQPAVDLCCGDGSFTTSLSSCLARPCKVYAMNLVAGLIEHAPTRRRTGEGELVAFAARTLCVWHAIFPNRWVSCC